MEFVAKLKARFFKKPVKVSYNKKEKAERLIGWMGMIAGFGMLFIGGLAMGNIDSVWAGAFLCTWGLAIYLAAYVGALSLEVKKLRGE